MPTKGVHCRESAGAGPAALKAVPVLGASFSGITITQNLFVSLFPYLISSRWRSNDGSEVMIECSYDSPPPCQRRFQNRFRPFSSSFLSFLLVRPLHVDIIIVNASLSRICFFNLAACSGEYSLLSGPCNRRFGRGAIVETLDSC